MSTTVPGLPPLSRAPGSLVACPDCGLRVEPVATGCPRCGAALQAEGGVWREGRTLVALRDAILPGGLREVRRAG